MQDKGNGSVNNAIPTTHLGRNGAPKVIVIPLIVGQTFQTGGSTTVPVYTPIDNAQLRNLGPMIQQLRVHWFAEWCSSANFQGKLDMQWSITGETWSTPVTILTAQTGDTQVIGAWYTTDANFGLLLRLILNCVNASGTAIESGRLTVYLEVELKS